MEKIIELKTYDEILSVLEVCSDTLDSLKKNETVRRNFADKFCKYGTVIVLKENDSIAGFIAFYANDKDTKTAYISMIAVLSEFKHKGYGKKLIDNCHLYSKKNGMNHIKLEVNKSNINAIGFYKHLGFTKCPNEKEKNIFMELNI